MAKTKAATKAQDQFNSQTHPQYDECDDVWRLAAENSEGDENAVRQAEDRAGSGRFELWERERLVSRSGNGGG